MTNVAYMLNMNHTKRLKTSTPEEAWSRDKPLVHHLRIFMSLCYKHIPYEKKEEVDDKSETFMLFEYQPIDACKLYNSMN